MHKFTAPELRMLNRGTFPTNQKKAEFLVGMSENLILSIGMLKDLTAWIEDICQNTAECGATQGLLNQFVDSMLIRLTQFSQQSVANKDAVGQFVTEVLRCTNFALHDKNKIQKFCTIITQCGILIDGDAGACIEQASFADLRYVETTHKIRMQPHGH
jgi:hypothetical protein